MVIATGTCSRSWLRLSAGVTTLRLAAQISRHRTMDRSVDSWPTPRGDRDTFCLQIPKQSTFQAAIWPTGGPPWKQLVDLTCGSGRRAMTSTCVGVYKNVDGN